MFDRIRHLLVALDLDPASHELTPGSHWASDQGLRLAQHLDARVTLLHSSAADERWEPRTGEYVAVHPGLRDGGEQTLHAVQAHFRSEGVKTELALPAESAAIAIVRQVLRDDVDLVLSGKRNETDRPGHRIGSVANKLLRKCPCPVWVAKPGGAVPPRRLLAATDLSAVGEKVVRLAAGMAQYGDAELHVTHAIQITMEAQIENSRAEYERSHRAEARKTIEGQLAAASYPGKADLHIGVTAPTRAILECVERIDPHLVVMGTVSRGGVAGFLVGNTAERLLGRLDCSLLTVKPDDFVCPVQLD